MRIAILIAISLFIVACAAQAPAPQTQEQTPPPAQETPVVKEEPSEPPQQINEGRDVATVFDGLPEDVQEILDNGRNNAETKGFSYKINTFDGKFQSTHPTQGAMVHQKGDLVKLELAEPKQRVNPADHVEIIYLNLAEMSAKGECNSATLCGSEQGSRTVTYAHYAFTTPSDWIEQMDDPVKMEERTIQSRKAVRLDADVNGTQTTIWVDRFSGLPVQVEQGDTIYYYESFALGAKDSEVMAG